MPRTFRPLLFVLFFELLLCSLSARSSDALAGAMTGAAAQTQPAATKETGQTTGAPAAQPATPPATLPATPAAPAGIEPPSFLEPVLQPVRGLSIQLDDLEKAVDRVQEREDELSQVRLEIDKIPADARRAIDAIRPRLDDARAQLEKLGPAPKPDQPAEAAEIAADRARLAAIVTQLDGAMKSAELSAERARQLNGRVQEYRQKLFAAQVLRRTKQSPLKLSLWQDVAGAMPKAAREVAAIGRGWWLSASARWMELVGILALALVVYFVLRALRRRVVRRRLLPASEHVPRFFERAAVASVMAPAIALPAAAASILVYVGLESRDLLYLQTARFAEVALTALLIFIAVAALSRAILQPGRGNWRLLNLSGHSARRLNWLTRTAAMVYGIDLVLKDVIRMLYLPFQVSVAQAFVFSLVFAGLLLALARTPLEPRVADVQDLPISRWQPYWLKLPLVLVAVAIAVASLLGYVALGRYISAQVVLTATAVVGIVLLHLAIRAAAGDSSIPGDSVGARLLSGVVTLDEFQQAQIDRVVYIAFNLVLAFLAVPLLLAAWGFSAPEIIALVNSAIFGFDIAGVRISPTRILAAIALFIILVFATRLVQRWLSATVLQPSRIDSGLANSIHTGVGYAGYAIAALVAVSYGGLDITNVAIIAGALSVGIGFGMQSIANNFVSGLILLVERPVKVGDWIGVGNYEGHVRRISVRSTEIETFDRSSVIVPNSELITSSVKNRTHRNALGRVDVAVGVAYNSDPEAVKALLEKVALESQMVLKFPAPVVSFDNFAASSLDFTVRAYVSDVNKSVATATDLRLRIFKALQQAGIEIPFPQTDVHLRDLDLVKAVVGRIAEERARKAAEAQVSSNEPPAPGMRPS